jgi:glycerol transport system ATP-binding protein
VGLRAIAISVFAKPGDILITGKVELAEISGSDTFLHASTSVGEVVAQLTGVHHFELGVNVSLYFNPMQIYLFSTDGLLIQSPVRGGRN